MRRTQNVHYGTARRRPADYEWEGAPARPDLVHSE
jgi:hypothetical protein